MHLTPAQRALVRRRTAVPETEPGEVSGELNIIPFLDIVVNLVMFLLVTTTAVLAVSQVEVTLDEYGPPCVGAGCHDPALGLNVTVADEGIVVAGSGGRLAPGCEGLLEGEGTTLPRGADGYDFAGLRSCAARIKQRFPAESEVTLTADPDVPYEELVNAMDALRHDGRRPLFTDVAISAGVR